MTTRPANRSANRSAIVEQLARLCSNGRIAGSTRAAALPTGFQALDALLPGGGWPMGAVTELMPDTAGLGELSVLMPALAELTQSGRYLALIEPPWLPQAMALTQRGVALQRTWMVRTRSLQESLWAAEQALRCPTVGAVLVWPAQLVDKSIRRLQLAAETGGSLGVLYRPPLAALEPSPAALRLRLHAAPIPHDGVPGALNIEVHKSRGSSASSRRHCTITPQAAPMPQATCISQAV